ncbi:hypothetical protein [Leifsonia sp. 22587]|uniref:hypothetical protein n=1 Tax=Leifsonia sp. 22587 TaxID=3453946 RepID=UPI003F840BD8
MLLEEFVDMRVRAGETARTEAERGRRARAAEQAGGRDGARVHHLWERVRRARVAAADASAAAPQRELAHASR